MSRWVLAVVALLSLSALVGCGPTAKDKLTGKWAGKIEVDQAALDKKIASIPNPIEAGAVRMVAEGYKTATLDANLNADNTMSTHLKVGPLSQEQTGTWAVKSFEGDKVTLTLVEKGNPRDVPITLTEDGFIMAVPGDTEGLARVVFKKAP